MRAIGSSLGAWRLLERQEGIKVPHGLVFSLATLAEIGRPVGLELVAEEEAPWWAPDAILVSVLDSRCLINAAAYFRGWGIPLRRRERRPVGRYPLVWFGGQGNFNAAATSEMFDLAVIGDAEGPLPVLLNLWERHGNTPGFLAAASTVEGVYVPDHHHPGETTVKQAVADDIGVTLRSDISVSHDGTRRLEIARGCRYKCAFCSLGWRAPVRENPASEVVAEIMRSPKRVHLQAGDAESHSGIDVIREALRAHGGSDQGWTGRLDSLFENPDQTIPGQKRYAFGVEGVSYRLRRAVGKGYLTDERLISDTVRFFDAIEGDGKGRAAWHIITGLPGQRTMEAIQLVRVIQEIDRRRQGKTARNLALHWQPFQPLPGTPMQWFGTGSGARKVSGMMSGLSRQAWVRVRHVHGRTDEMAALCGMLARSGPRGVDLIQAVGERRVRVEEARALCGTHEGPLDPDALLPWDFIETPYPRSTLRRAYQVVLDRLEETNG